MPLVFKLQKATTTEIAKSCLEFHYAKRIPPVVMAFSVFMQSKFCGVVIYSHGASARIGSPFYGLDQRAILELVRVALNGKQGKNGTSEILSISIRLIKRLMPQIKLLVSFADPIQDHVGIIYQATNWIYTGREKNPGPRYSLNGESIHAMSVNAKFGTCSLLKIKTKYPTLDIKYLPRIPKLKYIYPMKDHLKKEFEKLSQPYIKRVPTDTESGYPPDKDGLNPIHPLHNLLPEEE